MSKIKTLNNRKWTGVTEVAQTASEAIQDARAAIQTTYDAAQGNGGAARNAAKLAEVEAAAGIRANHQSGQTEVPGAGA